MPIAMPIISANQSLISALRLKLGWMSSIIPPNKLAPINTGSNPKRPVLDRGKDRAAKATRCMSLSLPSGACGGETKGQSMATVRMVVAISVSGMSRYLRIRQGYCSQRLKATSRYEKQGLLQKRERCLKSYTCLVQ